MAQLIIADGQDKFLENLLTLITESANEAISKRGRFLIGVSGGSCVRFLISILEKIDSDISKWVFFFCDERLVPENDPNSTFGAYRKALDAARINIPDSQFIRVKRGVSAEEAAEDYKVKVYNYFPKNTIPKFDLLILGMGPDGHTCSLFPGHKLLTETAVIAPITDSPKPPSERITLTLPTINNSERTIFAVTGEDKALVLKEIFIDKKTTFPAAQVNIPEKVFWVVDSKAASQIKR